MSVKVQSWIIRWSGNTNSRFCTSAKSASNSAAEHASSSMSVIEQVV